MFKMRSPKLSARLLAFVAFSVGIFGAPFAHAGDKHGVPDSARAEKRIERFVVKMEKELKLSKEQAEKIRAILRKDPVSPRSGMGGRGMAFGPHKEFAAQLRSGEVDTAVLNRSFEERVGAMRARHASMVAKFAEVTAVLTPEQRKKAADLLEQRGKKAEKRHKRGCGMSCPH